MIDTEKSNLLMLNLDLLECLEAFADPYKSGNVRNSLKGFKFKPPVLLQEDELRDCLAPEYRSSEEPCYVSH